MKLHQRLVCIALVLAAGPAFAQASGCGMPDIRGMGELHRFLSLRAIEVIRQAASGSDGLAALVSPSASFNFGAGDVGRPLGMGIAGARELARSMGADTYRFFGWDYMDMPVDPCSTHKVQVEFIDREDREWTRVEFTFEAGRVVSAAGWERSFETGRLQEQGSAAGSP